MTRQPGNWYSCAECGGRYESDLTTEEAVAEKDIDFRDVALKDCAMVCEDCYQKLMPKRTMQ